MNNILAGLKTNMGIFMKKDEFPFEADEFVQWVEVTQKESSDTTRTVADFLAGFGSEAYPDEKN